MKDLIVYSSNYGTTEAYAHQLANMIKADISEYAKDVDVSNYDRVIYMGGLYAGKVTNLKKFAKNMPTNKKFVVITVGIASVTEQHSVQFIEKGLAKQIPTDVYASCEKYHLLGALEYDKMSAIHRVMMKMLTYMIRLTKKESERTEDDKNILSSYGKTLDLVNFADLDKIAEQLSK